MKANDLTNEVPVLKLTDTVGKARELVRDNCICDLPVVKNKKLTGIFPGDLIFTADEDSQIDAFKEDFLNIFVNQQQHILDVFQVASLEQTTIVPVIDNEGNYSGSIRIQDLVKNMSEDFSLGLPGGIITLTLDARDFHLSEIARIVESNDARILNILTSFSKDGSGVEVTLKVNHQDIKHISATFERFGYRTTLYYEEGFRFDNLKERFDYLMKFIDM